MGGKIWNIYIYKEDSASPTVNIEAIMITSAIEAHGGRHLAIIDILVGIHT